MPTLLLRLVGPLQSWGTTSRFNERDTGQEPSKSGVLGILAAARGIDRDDWHDLEPLCRMKMGVRHDRPGLLKSDFQTVACAPGDIIIKADGSMARDGGLLTTRYYLADAGFLVGMESEDLRLLDELNAALHNPAWPLYLGRKSYVPSESVFLEDGVRPADLEKTLRNYVWIGKVRPWEKHAPEKLLLSLESEVRRGAQRMDQPLAAFSERRYGARFVRSAWIETPKEAADVPA